MKIEWKKFSVSFVQWRQDKLKNDGNYKYDSVIVRVGTNDLAYADKVAKNMDDLINEVKPHTMKTAVSSVIFGYAVCSYLNHIELKSKVFLRVL